MSKADMACNSNYLLKSRLKISNALWFIFSLSMLSVFVFLLLDSINGQNDGTNTYEYYGGITLAMLMIAVFLLCVYLGLFRIIPGLYTVNVSPKEINVNYLFTSFQIPVNKIYLVEHKERTEKYRIVHYLKITYKDIDGKLAFTLIKPNLLGSFNNEAYEICTFLVKKLKDYQNDE